MNIVVVVCLFILGFDLLFAYFMSKVANSKGYNGLLFAVIGFFFPIFYLLILMMPYKTLKVELVDEKNQKKEKINNSVNLNKSNSRKTKKIDSEIDDENCEIKNNLFKALLILILVYVVLSWFVPVGYFSNGSFVKDAVSPVGIFDFIIYPLVTATSSVFVLTAIVFLLIGGFYGVVNKTGIYSNLLQSLAKKWKGKEKTILVVSTLIFTVLSSLTGLNLPLFILVPFVAALLMLMGYSKITAMLSTVGGILAGNIASTYGFNVAGYISYLTENINDSIWVRLVMLVLVSGLLIFTVLKTAKLNKTAEKNIPLYEDSAKKVNGKTAKPFVIMFVITMLVLIIGMFNWNGVFKIELFDNILTSIQGFKIGDYAIFANLLGSIPAVGSWTNYEIGVILIINALIIGRLYGLTWSEIVNSFVEGMKKMVPVAVWTMAASILFLLMNTNSSGYTMYNTISNSILGLTDKLNVFTMSLTTLIGSILYNDFPYLLSALYAPITSLYTNFSLIGIITQIIHGIVQFIAPTSVILVAGLTYFDIPYTEWLKKFWKFFLGLLMVGIIVIILMLLFA